MLHFINIVRFNCNSRIRVEFFQGDFLIAWGSGVAFQHNDLKLLSFLPVQSQS
jgi:hypothetical protein